MGIREFELWEEVGIYGEDEGHKVGRQGRGESTHFFTESPTLGEQIEDRSGLFCPANVSVSEVVL